jgi:hypothetical protein
VANGAPILIAVYLADIYGSDDIDGPADFVVKMTTWLTDRGIVDFAANLRNKEDPGSV